VRLGRDSVGRDAQGGAPVIAKMGPDGCRAARIRDTGHAPMTHATRLYDRFWTPDEIRNDGDMLRGLHREPTLFRVAARPAAETAPHAGPLSLKMVTRGESLYRFGRSALAVQPGQVLVVPPTARYSTGAAQAGADIVTFYFPSAWVADAVSALASTAGALLDGDQADAQVLDDFPAHHRATTPRLARLVSRLPRGGRSAGLDLTMDALEETVRLGLAAVGAIARVPAARASVRSELFRRAARGRSMIEAHPARDDTLSDLAKAACLSPFHFHRVFRAAFGETPVEMRRRLRMARAQTLLATGRQPIGEIARSVGFDNDAAFSRAFRASVGVPPTAFRRAAGF
jgi:AraC-like DNA-binding protein